MVFTSRVWYLPPKCSTYIDIQAILVSRNSQLPPYYSIMLSAGPETVELELKEDFLDWKTPDKNIGIDSIVSRIPMSHSRPPRPKNGSIPLDKFDSIIFEEIQESERMFVRFSLSKTTFLIPGLGYSLSRQKADS